MSLTTTIACFLMGCNQGAIAPPTTAPPEPLPIYGGSSADPPADAIPYASGDLDAQEINALLHLAFPQSYDAIKNRLGLPAYRTKTADYYQLGDRRWVMVVYSDATAIGFQFGTRN
jgi:hypothetical protein